MTWKLWHDTITWHTHHVIFFYFICINKTSITVLQLVMTINASLPPFLADRFPFLPANISFCQSSFYLYKTQLPFSASFFNLPDIAFFASRQITCSARQLFFISARPNFIFCPIPPTLSHCSTLNLSHWGVHFFAGVLRFYFHWCNSIQFDLIFLNWMSSV